MSVSASRIRTGSSSPHRAMLRFPRDGRGALAGVSIAIAVGVFVLAFSGIVWRAERTMVDGLLRFSSTHATVSDPHAPLFGASAILHGGARYSVPAHEASLPAGAAAAGIAVLTGLTLWVFRAKRLPLPARVIWLMFAVVTATTLAYTAWVSGSPPRPVGTLAIGFQRSGLLGIVIATLLFAAEVFPVPGPLRVKAGWLAGLIAFAFVWSVVRMAVTLATVTHVGSWTFLYLQYGTGPFMDFLYVVAFYSFATSSLARHAEGTAIA